MHKLSILDSQKTRLNWKGDKASYFAIHAWVRLWKPKPPYCEKCGIVNNELELANIDHKYRRVLEDYNWFCFKCHAEYDKDKGLRYGDEFGYKMHLINSNKKLSEEHKKKISLGLTGKKLTDEHKKNIALGHKKRGDVVEG